MDAQEKQFWKKVYLLYGITGYGLYSQNESLWKESYVNAYYKSALIGMGYVLVISSGEGMIFEYFFTDKFMKEIVDAG